MSTKASLTSGPTVPVEVYLLWPDGWPTVLRSSRWYVYIQWILGRPWMRSEASMVRSPSSPNSAFQSCVFWIMKPYSMDGSGSLVAHRQSKYARQIGRSGIVRTRLCWMSFHLCCGRRAKLASVFLGQRHQWRGIHCPHRNKLDRGHLGRVGPRG